MKAEGTSTCQTCGALVPAGIDFCPVCALLRAGGNDSGLKEALNPAPDSAETEVGLARVLGNPARPDEGGSEPHSTTQQIVRRFENYEVMLDQDGQPIELGRSAMGITYKAFDSDLRFPVTLKVISEKYVGDEAAKLRFLREAQAAAKVRHPNVASVFHLGSSGGEYFYVTEFVEGETLENLIKRCGRLEVKPALEIASQVAAGLEAIHEQQLIHRDIKPTNIVVRLKADGRVTAKIIDLGLAREVTETGSQSAISNLGAFAGTPAFASPEQLAGLGLDIRSDLYSLGVTLWEMLAGQAPFSGSAAEVIDQHKHSPLPLEQLKGVHQPLVILLGVLLEKDPAQRIQSPVDLLNAIQFVRAAIDADRSMAPKDLKAIFVRRRVALQRTGRFPERVKTLFGPLAWMLVALLITGLVILTVNAFFGVRRLATESPVTPSASINAPEKSIAVLPFESLSGNKGDTYFADGVQDEILSKLAKLSQLKVISRTSVMAYRPPSNRDVHSIGTALGVAHLVEGTVRRDGDRVRITTELIDARTDETLWSESYQRDLTDIFAIQNEIAETVASKLSAQLSPEEQKKIGQWPTTNLEAYDLYLQAKDLLADPQNAPLSNWPKAIRLVEQAIQKDPKFTLAYCFSAKAHADMYHWWMDRTPERRSLADAALDEALRLEPDSAEAHLAAAYHLYESYGSYEQASVQVALAQKALPNSSEVLRMAARIDMRLGRWEESTKALEKAHDLDPQNLGIISLLGGHYRALRRFREAEQLGELTHSENELFRTGDWAKVWAEQQRQPALTPAWRSNHFWLALFVRDWAAASEILAENPDEDLFNGQLVKVPIPRGCGEIWLAALEGKHPTLEGRFKLARDQLAQRVEANPDDVQLLSVLGAIDAFLGRKQEAIDEATRATALQAISRDALKGREILANLSLLYIWANESDLAFEKLAVLIKTPPLPPSRAMFAPDPELDPIRNDPRFDQLLAQIPTYP